MSPSKLPSLLAVFRRQMLLLRLLRVAAPVVFLLAVGFSTVVTTQDRGTVVLALVGMLAFWVMLAWRSAQVARQVQAGHMLLNFGKLDDAEVWLRRGMSQFTISAQVKLAAGQLLAALFFERHHYAEVVLICRELLRQPLARLRNLWVSTRLMLADSLLMLDRLAEAHEAMLPVYGVPLSLEARTRLLPVQLRYELAAGHAATTVANLKEKVQIAELLDARDAALVHALLAEGCRRQNMPTEAAFLTERARLYHDLPDLAKVYPVIAPIAGDARSPS